MKVLDGIKVHKKVSIICSLYTIINDKIENNEEHKVHLVIKVPAISKICLNYKHQFINILNRT